jgi:hypothetical protein
MPKLSDFILFHDIAPQTEEEYQEQQDLFLPANPDIIIKPESGPRMESALPGDQPATPAALEYQKNLEFEKNLGVRAKSGANELSMGLTKMALGLEGTAAELFFRSIEGAAHVFGKDVLNTAIPGAEEKTMEWAESGLAAVEAHIKGEQFKMDEYMKAHPELKSPFTSTGKGEWADFVDTFKQVATDPTKMVHAAISNIPYMLGGWYAGFPGSICSGLWTTIS